MSGVNDGTREEQARQEPAGQEAEAAVPDKAQLIARIRARRGKAVAESAIAQAEAALAELDRRAARQSRKSVVSAGQAIPVQAQLLPDNPERARLAARGDAFPRSATMRLLLDHPALCLLGAGLLWKVGPSRLLLVSRLVLPLIRR